MTIEGSTQPDPSGATITTAFERQMDLTPDPATPGRYHVDVSPDWNCPVIPHGGVMAALAARAMAAELSEDVASGMTLRSLTTVFAAQVPAGPVTIDVDVLRRGRSMSQATASVARKGATDGHTTMAVFGASRPGFEFTELVQPDVPSPQHCPSFRDPRPEVFDDPFPNFPIWEKMIEGRPAMGHPPWEDYLPTASDCATWYRLDEPPVRSDGALDPLALVTFCDTMPQSVRERLGAGHPWFPPSADLTVHILGEARSEWVLAHKRARWSGDGYASLEIALWDPAVGLVAHGSQMMFFVFPDGPPPPDQRVPADQRPDRPATR